MRAAARMALVAGLAAMSGGFGANAFEKEPMSLDFGGYGSSRRLNRRPSRSARKCLSHRPAKRPNMNLLSKRVRRKHRRQA